MQGESSDRGLICQAWRSGQRHRLWLNQGMFARKIRVEYEDHGKRLPCP